MSTLQTTTSSASSASSSSSSSSAPAVQSTRLISRASTLTRLPVRKTTREIIASWMESIPVQIFITTFTILALFLDDIRVWAVPKSQEDAVFNVMLLIFIIFSLELVINSCVQPNYFLTLFWILDIVSLLSLIPDIPLIWDPLLLSFGVTDVNNGVGSNLTVARAARVSRVGTRAGRVVRLVRLIRVVRMAKLWESCLRTKDRVERHRAEKDKSEETSDEGNMSKVGQHLSEKTTRRVVFVVLTMQFVVPYLQTTDMSLAELHGFQYLQTLASFNNITNTTFLNAFDNYRHFGSAPDWYLLSININGTRFSLRADFEDVNNFRDGELKVVPDNFNEFSDFVIFSNRVKSQQGGMYGVCVTCLVVFLLGVGSMLFSKDANELVIVPIERMVAIIEQLKRNPLARGKDIQKSISKSSTVTSAPSVLDRTKTFFTKMFSSQSSDPQQSAQAAKSEEDAAGLETGVLEKTLEKLTRLLQVGFGEAGSNIISKNISNSGTLNPLVDGSRMLAIFGFCDIRGFQDITQALQADIFLFVNTIAEIVHSEVHRGSGAANKNIGEAFLLVWRLPVDMTESDLQYVSNGGDISNHPRKEVLRQARILADKALAGFLRVICRVAGSPQLYSYGLNPALAAKFPDFRVSMGFGLHVGWAIEGAIGSKYKIDASYLSPNVNMAARLEAATRQFGVRLLMSGTFHSLLSPAPASKSRLIDCVKVKGSAQPMNLFCYDINNQYLENLRSQAIASIGQRSSLSSQKSINARRKTNATNNADNSQVDFNSDQVLSKLQLGILPLFFESHRRGVVEYLKGNFAAAAEHLKEALSFDAEDGPSKVILNYMSKTGFVAPSDWANCRQLTSK